MHAFDLDAAFKRLLLEDRRPPDDKLHASSDLTGPMRHVMLHAAGAPTLESETASDTRLMIGTLLHNYYERIFRGWPAMIEVKLDPWLPRGWSGTADHVPFNVERKAFVLNDLKSIRADGLTYILTEGIKKEHQHQVSLYWYGLRNMGLPLVKGYTVHYLPKEPIIGQKIEPLLMEGTPLDEGYLIGLANERRHAVDTYLRSLSWADGVKWTSGYAQFVTDDLAAEPEKELRLMWNKAVSKAEGKERPGFELKRMPVWQTTYCPFPNDICACSEQRPDKIGHWLLDDDGIARFAFSRGKADEGIKPEDHPMTKAQIKRIVEATKKES